MDLLTYCQKLPKVELHAHLNGSLSDSTILKLLQAKRTQGAEGLPESAEVTIQRGHHRTLQECFEVFKILHSLTDSVEAVKTITRDVIREFAADNVKYLELRTTPKHIPGKMTKQEYTDAVLQAIREEMETSKIMVRLLLSVDRARGLEDAASTLQLAKTYLNHDLYKGLVCGLDISGNPQCGDLKDYVPVLEEAKKCGLKLAVHLAEVPNEAETAAVLSAGLVDRIGHGTFIHPHMGGSLRLHQHVTTHHIPIEICLSSNVKSGTVKSLEDHHFPHWMKESHPLLLCTDDKGVFSTSLSEEFYLCAKTFELGESSMQRLCEGAVEAAFLPHHSKEELRQTVQGELASLQGKLSTQH